MLSGHPVLYHARWRHFFDSKDFSARHMTFLAFEIEIIWRTFTTAITYVANLNCVQQMLENIFEKIISIL